MQCPKCQFENTERAKTCARCGTVLDRSGSQPQEPARKRGCACSVTGSVIIALLLIVLVVIVFPILNRALRRLQPKARSTSCLGNVKQLQLAMLMYANDNDDTMPPASEWCDAVFPYAKNYHIYTCPDAGGRSGEGVATYAMNDDLYGRDLSAVPSPEATLCIFDSTFGWNMHGGPSLVVNRHNKGAYFGFADGHAKWVGPGSPSSYTWYLPPPPAGRDAAPQPLDPEEGE